MQPKKILIFSLMYYPRFVAGAEVAIKEITDRISPSEVEFDMVTLRMDSDLPRYEKIGNINVYRVGGTWGYKNIHKYLVPFTGFLKAQELSKKNKYDATWSIIASYNSFAALIFKLANPRIPFILNLQEGDPISYIKRRVWFVYPLFKMIFTRADYIHTLSQYLADWAQDMGAKCPIKVVPNAVDFDLFNKRQSEEELNDLKNRLNKKEGDVFVITTSRLVLKNAVGDVIDALTYLPENVKFLILGSGYQEKILKEKVEKLGLKERVRFLGYVAHKDMPKYLHVSDIFIRPSLSEGFGNSYIEAMAAGIPIIATQVGGIPDFLKDGETGLFCDVKSPRSIAQKIEKLIKDKESREYIIKNSIELVKEKYTWEKIMPEMKKVFGI